MEFLRKTKFSNSNLGALQPDTHDLESKDTYRVYGNLGLQSKGVVGELQVVIPIVKRAINDGSVGSVLIFDDATGKLVDIDVHGSYDEVVNRIATPESTGNPIDQPADSIPPANKARDRGRPKLGVVAREVTLLPRHWEWLAAQPGGASVTLRRLVEEARRANSSKDRIRNAQNRAYNFLSALCGDMPAFEEAACALFANDQAHFRELIAAWPDDVRDYAIRLAFGDGDLATPENS